MIEQLYKHHLQEEEEENEEQEEALSLCDLPLNDNDELQNDDESKTAGIPNRRTSSSSPEPDPDQLFEFFSNFSSEMSSAEDIIFCGKLVPFKDLSPDPQIQTHYINSDQNQNRQHSSFRRRSESLSGLQYSSVSRSNSINSSTKFMMRNSRSLDYRRLERFSSSKTSSSESENSIDRNSSSRSSIGRGESMSKRTTAAARPRWYVLMFGGVVKPPVEMELSDIKSRQVRRNISSKKPPVSKSNNTPSCRLLKVLSCRDNTSVAVTTPLWIPPPA